MNDIDRTSNPDWGKETREPDAAVATATLSTSQLESVVAAFVAAHAGMRMPLTHTARWGWAPGQGPVLLGIVVREAPNVLRMPVRRGG